MMKRPYLILLLLSMLMAPFAASAQQSPPYGDVNGDLEVNIADVNTVIDIILDGNVITPAADVNGDGEINIADINAVIDIILGGGTPKTLFSTLLVTTRDGRTVEHIIDQNTRLSIEQPNLVIETGGTRLTYDLEQTARLRYGHRYVSAAAGAPVVLDEGEVMPDGDERPQYALFTYRNDGGFNAFLNIDVDSVTYSNTDLDGVIHPNAVVQQVWTPDSLYRIPLAAIDSIGFKAPPTEYKPNVVIIDERHMPYIVDASDSTITFNSSVPTDMVPTMGQIMYSDLTDDPFYMGFAGRVIGIERKNSQVTYFCDPVAPNEVYERCVNFFKVVTDTTEVIDENVPANSPRRIGTFIATDGTISMPELKWNLDFNLNKLTDCHGNVKLEGKINNDFEYVICIGMLDHDFINVKHTKKITHSTNVSFKIENKAECDTSIFTSTPVYTTGCQWFGVSLYPGLFFDAKIAAELEAKLPYSSTQVEEYYFGSDRGWTDPLITSNESGGWPGFGEFLTNGNVKFKFNGTLAFGPTVKAAFVVWKPKTFNFGVTAKGGLELSGECSCDLTELVDDAQFDWYDDVWSNTKITTGLKLGFNISGKIMKKECNIWGASTTLFKQEKYLFPKFTMPTLPQFQNGTWQPSAAPTSMYTTPSNELLLPGKVGLGVYDQNGTCLRNSYYGWYFGTEDNWPQNAVQCSLAGLEAGREYVVRPLYKMLDLFEIKGGPRTVFYSPEPMGLEKPSLQLIKGTRGDVAIIGGWGVYSASTTNSKVATATVTSTWASGVETFLVRVEAVSPGDATINVKDVRSGDVVALPVKVVEGQSKPLYVAEEALDFGVVATGTTTSKTLTLINSTTSPKTVTATVTGPFSFQQGNSSVSSLTVEVPGSSCSYVTVQFTASGQGTSTGNVTFVNELFDGGKCIVPVTAYATANTAPLYVEQQSLDLGEVPMGSTRTGELTIVNNSTSVQTVTAAIDAPFSFSQGQSSTSTLTIQVPSCSRSTVTVLYTATDAGTASGNATFTSEALQGGSYVVPVQAFTPADGQSLYIEQSSLDLGTVLIGETHTGELTIVNNTAAAKTVTCSVDAPFWFQQGESCVSAKTIVVPGNSCASVTVQFTATTIGDFNANVTFKNSALDGGQCIVPVQACAIDNDTNHEWVDLGLPSGTLWATCNVGASAPEGYGDYFAWGETAPKDYYAWSTYKWCNGSYRTMTKYCTDSYYGSDGFTDGKTELDPEDDAAYVNWGPSWRMPTTEQQRELYENCSSVWTTQNGVNGRLFTGPNGNTLFLPAAGGRWDESLYNAGSGGYYWSRTLGSSSPSLAFFLGFYFNSGYVGWGSVDRYYGFTVRAVRVSQN